MKNLNLLLVFAAMVLLSSCGKDFSETIIGTWTLKSVTTNAACEEPELQNVIVDENGCIIQDGESYCISFVISENGIATGMDSFDGELETYPLTYTVNEDTEVISLCDDGDCNDVTKVGDDLQFTVTEDGCDLVYTFEKN